MCLPRRCGGQTSPGAPLVIRRQFSRTCSFRTVVVPYFLACHLLEPDRQGVNFELTLPYDSFRGLLNTGLDKRPASLFHTLCISRPPHVTTLGAEGTKSSLFSTRVFPTTCCRGENTPLPRLVHKSRYDVVIGVECVQVGRGSPTYGVKGRFVWTLTPPTPELFRPSGFRH